MKITYEGSPEELAAMLRELEGTTPALPLIPIPPSPTTVPTPMDEWSPLHQAYSPPYYSPVTGGTMIDGIVASGSESMY